MCLKFLSIISHGVLCSTLVTIVYTNFRLAQEFLECFKASISLSYTLLTSLSGAIAVKASLYLTYLLCTFSSTPSYFSSPQISTFLILLVYFSQQCASIPSFLLPVQLTPVACSVTMFHFHSSLWVLQWQCTLSALFSYSVPYTFTLVHSTPLSLLPPSQSYS